MSVRTLVGAVVLAAVVVMPLAACGDDGGPSNEAEAREELTSQLTAEAGIPEADAQCIVDRLFEAYSFEELDSLDLNDEGELPEQLQSDLVDFTLACISGEGGTPDTTTG